MANKLPGVQTNTGPVFVVEGKGEEKFGPAAIEKLGYPAIGLFWDDMQLYLERRAQYGPSEEGFGHLMAGLFPNGLTLQGQENWARYGLLHQIVAKLVRYCNNFPEHGHADSLRDLRVYAAMLQARDEG